LDYREDSGVVLLLMKEIGNQMLGLFGLFTRADYWRGVVHIQFEAIRSHLFKVKHAN
jgi:hypothetical protein